MASVSTARAGALGWRRHLRAIALLPFMNTVVIPSLLLWQTGSFDVSWLMLLSPQPMALSVGQGGVLLLIAGIALVYRSIELFVRIGQGTLAPWDPTRSLIVEGIYRHVRNPMKAGLFAILIAEAILLRSVALTCWAAFFITVNAIYIRVSEEPGLRKRFGPAYQHYCDHVPRWIPRLRPWSPESTQHAGAPR
jgi:protein-S-isoprenylcysteine O-methyltransferase Ste14